VKKKKDFYNTETPPGEFLSSDVTSLCNDKRYALSALDIVMGLSRLIEALYIHSRYNEPQAIIIKISSCLVKAEPLLNDLINCLTEKIKKERK
jgi:hypothetical protein